MQIREQKGQLYLGRYVQSDGGAAAGDPFFYAARDLTTHAVCVGMTGSGKTGLGVALLEEIALNGLPALVIDPKGDVTNLLLAFPKLLPSDFHPWVDVESARAHDLSLDAYAEQVARTWRQGLAAWGIDEARVARLKAGANFVIYTPGSDAGRSISILRSLQAPPLDWRTHAEVLRETISGTVSALLALLGVESDPITGREHSLLATIIEQAWRAGQDMDLAALIVQVQKPPFDRLGVLPLEVFFPEKDRLKLTLALNGLLASPQFSAWLEGDPMQVDALLRAPDGRPQIAIFSLAHLSDGERSFFVTLLLEQLRAWLRTQEGTVDLRAVLYFDELYGFMPPHPANPPTKAPLLALLKQARSQGLGVVLATQNPVDLDYKALSNAGTWFVGKLQTANDRQRVLEGLAGASTEAGMSLNRGEIDRMVAQLGARTWLVNNVHAPGPRLFQTRHTMSYLRGPLTRDQIRVLMAAAPAPVIEATASAQRRPAAPMPAAALPRPPAGSPWADFSETPPVLPTGIAEYFLPVQVSLEWAIRDAERDGRTIIYRDRQLVYRPALLARATARIDNDTRNVHERVTVSRVLPAPEDRSSLAWDAEPLVVDTDALDSRPSQGARFESLPSQFGDARRIGALERAFTDYVYRETAISLLYCPRFKLTARPDEPESRFKRRCYQRVAEKRDAELAKVDKSYTTKIERLQARIRREERELEQDEIEFQARKREELLSAGESVLGLFSKRRSRRTLSTASRKRRLTQQAKAEVDESLDAIADLESQIEALAQDMEEEQAEIEARWQGVAEQLDEELQTVLVRPRKSDIFVEAFGVVWMPYWHVLYDEAGLERRIVLGAFEASSGDA